MTLNVGGVKKELQGERTTTKARKARRKKKFRVGSLPTTGGEKVTGT